MQPNKYNFKYYHQFFKTCLIHFIYPIGHITTSSVLSTKILIFFFLINTPFVSFSQANTTISTLDENAYQFKHLTEQGQLANNTVHCAVMDDDGYIWFGTQDGLSRWDGTQVKNYYSILGDSTTLAGSMITDIAKDKNGHLWLVSHQGDLCRYNPKEDSFQTFPYPPFDNGVVISSEQAIFIDSDDIIWIGSFDDGIVRFDPQLGTFQQYNLTESFLNEEERFRKNSIFQIIEDINDTNLLWLAGNNGLYRMNKKTTEFTHFPSTRPYTDATAILAIMMDDPTHLWLATYSAGIVRFDIATATWNYFVHDKANWATLNPSVNIFYDLDRKSPHELWVTSQDAGAGIFNTQTGEFSFFQRNQDIKTSIGDDQGFKIYTDPQGKVWWLFRNNGVSYLDPSCQLFEYTDFGLKSNNQLLSRFISDITYDPIKNIAYAVGVSQTGCFEVDWNTKQVKPVLNQDFKEHYQHYNTIIRTKAGQIFIGANYLHTGNSFNDVQYASLLTLDPQQNQIVQYRKEQLQEIHQKNISHIIEDERQHLWLSTDDGFLFQYQPLQNKLTKYALQDFQAELHKTGITYFIKDPQRQQLLLASTKGIYSFDLKTKTFQLLNGTDNFTSRSIILSDDATLWIATRQLGIQAFDFNTNQLRSLRDVKNKPRTPIEKVFLDADQRLWATTEKGLVYLNNTTNTFQLFAAKDGLTKNYFYGQGYHTLPDGTILLGQQGGLYSFHPTEVKSALNQGQVNITNISANGIDYRYQNSSPSVELAYDQNALNITFSAQSYCQQDKIQFTYLMEGLDNNWMLPHNNQNNATYIGMPSGQYIFKVKKIGDETTAIASIPITIHPPIWRTWWAYLIYLSIIMLLIYAVFRFQLQQQRVQAETTRIKELDAFKTQFYTNITHEFRTPLTIISGMTEQIKKQPDQWLHTGLNMIQRNSLNLLNLINQMLDLQKLEVSGLTLKMVQGDIIAYIRYIFESYHSYAITRGVEMHFDSQEDSLLAAYDPEKLMQIISNLISNAIKFSKTDAHVYLTLSKIEKAQQSMLAIRLKDTGIGIAEEKLPFIFDRFFRIEEENAYQYEGTGIGLALTKELVELLNGEITVTSTVQVGTTFQVLLPILQQPTTDDTATSTPISLPTAPIFSPTESVIIEQDNHPTWPLILIIEDNADIRFYLSSCLKDKFRLIQAENGKIGVEKALAEVPDIIISDVMMPEMDGLEVCQHLKAAAPTSHIPIILLTAKAAIEDKIRGLEYGADAYLSKPFHPKELLTRINGLIENRKRLQAIYSTGELITTPVPKTEDVFLQKIQEIILTKLEQPKFGPNELAKDLNISRSQLHRKITALTSISTSNYINKIRLEEAKKLLQNNDLSISEIAYKVGYASPQYFNKKFAESFQCAPGEYRNKVSKT